MTQEADSSNFQIVDVKDAGSKGGKSAWAGKSKAERSKIMSARAKKRWKRVKAEKAKGKGEDTS